MKKQVHSDRAPTAIGPYSQAIIAGDFMYVSGQLPIIVESGAFAGNDIKSQTKQSLANVKSILEEAGYSMDDVVKSTVYLNDINDFTGMNGVYNGFFSEPYPARAAFAVESLPKAALVEIEVVAYRK